VSERYQRFAGLHQPGRPLFLPNAWDYASGAVLAQAGYPAIGTTSLGVAAAAGKPDATGAARQETVAVTRSLARLPVLVTVDIETGFSDEPAEVAALAASVAAAGAAGVNIEDGHPDGSLSPVELLCGKISAIKAAAPGLFVNARTDTFWLADRTAPPPVAQTLSRAAAYVAAGADGIYTPAVADPGMVKTLASAISAPLNILYLPGEHTLAELAAAGAGRVSTGSLLFRESLRSVLRTAAAARGEGVPAEPDRPSYAQVQAALLAG
jgi:2-methylisocitrate lyase-like PEP mutase family enzyme